MAAAFSSLGSSGATGLILWATLAAGSAAQAQIAVRVADEAVEVPPIPDAAGQVWLGTGRGAYRVTGHTARRIPDRELAVTSIQNVAGVLWIATEQGAFRVNGDQVEQILGDDFRVWGIRSIGGRVWLWTDTGAFRIAQGVVRRMPDEASHVWEVIEVAGDAWLSTDRGLYRVTGDDVWRVPLPQDTLARSMRVMGGDLWLTTEHGAYRIRGGVVRRIPDEDRPVQAMHEIGGNIFLTIERRVYRIEGDAAIPISHSGTVSEVFDVNGRAWIATTTGAHRVDGNVARRIPDVDLQVRSITYAGGLVWLATNGGAYRVTGEAAQRIPIPVEWEPLPVLAVHEVGGRVWLRTDRGAYRITGDHVQRIPDVPLRIRSIHDFRSEPWLVTAGGVYRVDETSTIDVDFRSALPQNAYLQRFLPASVWLSGDALPVVHYSSTAGGHESSPSEGPQFHIIVDTDREKFNRARTNGDYTPVERTRLPMSVGRNTVHISVRDQWQNTFSYTLGVWVVPAPAVTAGFVAVFWVTLLVMVMAFAPTSTFCNDLLMNPWLRKYGSFGTVPLALTTFASLRRHVLKRYLKNLREDTELAEAHRRYVVPDPGMMPDRFADRVQRVRVVLLEGPSGIGKTAYAKYLMIHFASAGGPRALPDGAIPVFIPLRRYDGEEPLRAFHVQLSNYGRLPDTELAAWFLHQGGFLLVVDGLNEVDQATRAKLARFVDQHWKTNYFCLTSQQNYPEFDSITRVTLAALGRAQILELLRRRLGDVKARAVVERFTDEMYEIYRIPQDLELAIELIVRDLTVPASRSALYAATLTPILDAWARAGRLDYPEVLFERAYEMLRRRETYFDRADRPLPDDLQGELVDKRVLVRRGGHCLFRHDLVRAYLAAAHFKPRWSTVLSDDTVAVDSNWDAMLEFTVLGLDDPRQEKELLFAVLRKNRHAASTLFKQIQLMDPARSNAWAEDFVRAYGMAML